MARGSCRTTTLLLVGAALAVGPGVELGGADATALGGVADGDSAGDAGWVAPEPQPATPRITTKIAIDRTDFMAPPAGRATWV
jgi:hypothetical protein